MPYWSCCLCSEWNAPTQENCGERECVHRKCRTCKIHWDMSADDCMLAPSKIPVRDIHVFKSGRRVRYHSIVSSFKSLVNRLHRAPKPPTPTIIPNSSTPLLSTPPSEDSSSVHSSEATPEEQLEAFTMPEVLELFNEMAAADQAEHVAEKHRRAMAAWQRASEARAVYTWDDYFMDEHERN